MHFFSTFFLLLQLSSLLLLTASFCLSHAPQDRTPRQIFYHSKPRELSHNELSYRWRPGSRESVPPAFKNTASDALPSDRPQMLVFAHFIVGNTNPYQVSDWARDIQLASGWGIDAFALNVGPDPWQSSRIADAYAAAQSINSDFKLFMSFDMSVLPCSSPSDVRALQNYIKMYATHPNQQLYRDRVLVSTFAGERCTFGQSNLDQAWIFAVKASYLPDVHFVPSFFVAPDTFSSMKEVDGQFNWNSGWPTDTSNLTFDSDNKYIFDLHGKTYMAAVSPWFFTHYSPQTYNKNFIYRSDEWLFVSRWEALIDNRNVVDLVQVISWNDYGESHYIGPIEGAQPNSQARVNGMDHQPWNDTMTYYIQAFKTGAYSDVERDRIFIMWSRLWPAGAIAKNDTVGKPTRWQDTEDTAWAVVFATSPANVTLTCSTSSVTFLVSTGVSKIKLPLVTPGQIAAFMTRESNSPDGYDTVVNFIPAGFEFKHDPATYNFNALVVASP